MWSITFLLGCSLAATGQARADAPGVERLRVYVGTYTGGKSRGIYLLELDPASGALTAPKLAGASDNPSFLAVHPTRRFLYAANEGGPGGDTVSAFAIDPRSGASTALNRQPSRGGAPCYVTVDRAGKNALVANYGGGSVAVLHLRADGRLEPASAFVQHKGRTGPHAHSINLDAENRFAVAADLGLDALFVYKFDPARGTLTPNDPPSAPVAPGSGPRHFAFHPDGRHAYVINENRNTVTAFDYDPTRGALKESQTISTLPDGFKGTSHTAEVQVHPSGKFLYGSNRGHDSIAIFAIDGATGTLRAVGHQPTGGKNPRNFGIDPAGAYLLAANQDSDSIVVFRIDPKTGLLEPTGHRAEVGRPVCVKFVPAGD